MANDRLYLVCAVCQDRTQPSKTWAHYVAKYYPSTGWYTNKLNPARYVASLDTFLDEHHLCSLETNGKNWTVGYEDDVPVDLGRMAE